MAENTVYVSLKGSSPTWRGLGDESTLEPTTGLFSTLDGVYISKDGTELRRAPGWRLGGQPFYGQEYALVARSGSVLHLDTLLRGTSTTSGEGQAWLKDGANELWVYVLGNDTITDGLYLASRTNADTITLAESFSGTSTANTSVFIQRGKHVHALTHIGQRVIGICETKTYRDSGTEEANNVSAVVSSGPLSFSEPPTVGAQDTEDAEEGFIFWPSPTLTGMTDGERGDSGTAADRKACAAQHIEIYRRIQADTLNRRVVLAVPGSGILHQVNLDDGPPWNPVTAPDVTGLPNHRWTKLLGIPKGQIGSAAQSTAGTLVDGHYGIAVGYWDVRTGEVGLPSSVLPVEIASGANVASINVNCVYPRGQCYDAAGLGIVVYCTTTVFGTAAEARVGSLLPVSFSGPFATTSDYALLDGTGSPISTFSAVSITVNIPSLPGAFGTLLPARFPVLENMPIGGSVVRVAKARVFSGGGYPEAWVVEAWSDTNTVGGATRYYISLPNDQLIHGGYGETPGTHGSIPTSFGGYRIQIRSVLGSGAGRGALLYNVVNETGTAGLGPRVWECDCLTGDSPVPRLASNTDEWSLRNELLRLCFTEEGFPQVSPSINRLELDSRHGIRLMGAARLGDSVLAMTEWETFLFGWNTAPRQSSQVTISNRFGCASPGSVVEGPFGAAWLSMEGPVVFGGQGITWIGRKIREFWSTVQKDSRGEVHNCTATVDMERTMVVWALRLSAWDAADHDPVVQDVYDREKAKQACDTLLCWNYETGEFSTITLPTPFTAEAVGVLPHDDGTMKVSWSSNANAADPTHPIYSWSESAEANQTVVTEATVASDRNGNTIVVAGDYTTFVAGTKAFVRSSDGRTCRWFGEIVLVSFAGGNTTFTVKTSDDSDHGADWKSGDVLVLGVVPMRLTTNRIHLGDARFRNGVVGVMTKANVSATYAYAKVTLTNQDGNSYLFTRRFGDRLRNGIQVYQYGHFRGDDMVIDMEVWADGRVNIKDIAMEAHVDPVE